MAALARERARIARELHDVVGHRVSVMVVQAGAAGKVIDAHPALARGALDAIAANGREAMSELRHLLGALSAADAPPEPDGPDDSGIEDHPQLAPQPGLAQLDAILDNVRAAGQPVTLHMRTTDLPPIVELTIYRIVQEALTNALRYAPGAATNVSVIQSEDSVLVEVVDDGVPDATPATAGAGSGLLGLAERLALHGASLETGRRLGGGSASRPASRWGNRDRAPGPHRRRPGPGTDRARHGSGHAQA